MSRPGALLLLQESDGRLERDRSRLAVTEAAVAGDPELDALRRTARRARREREAAEAELAAQEEVVAGLRQRTAALERHLYDGSVGNPQELLTMQRELDGLRARVAAEEDAELVLMERAEGAGSAERDSGAAVTERVAARAAAAPDVVAETERLRSSIAAEEAERASVAETLPAPDRALYERLRVRLRPAVVRLSGDSCGGCHMPLGNSEVHRVRAAEVPVQCATCDRVVVP